VNLDGNQLLASLLVSSIGLGLFMYGKKQSRLPQMVVGVMLMVFPYFVSSAWLVLLIGAALLGLFWLALRAGA
jgi:hypothetical protein